MSNQPHTDLYSINNIRTAVFVPFVLDENPLNLYNKLNHF